MPNNVRAEWVAGKPLDKGDAVLDDLLVSAGFLCDASMPIG